MREAMSDPMEVSDWALKSAGMDSPWVQAVLAVLGSCLAFLKAGSAADTALQGRERWDKTTGPTGVTVAVWLP